MKKNKITNIILNISIFVILPFLINAILESLGTKSFFGGIQKLTNDPYIFLCNSLIIASSLSIGVFLKRFRLFYVSIISFCWIALGIVNFFILCNRTLPFTAYDLRLFNTLPMIIKKYMGPPLLAVACLCIVAMLLGLTIVFSKALSAPKQKIKPLKSALCFIAVTALTVANLKFAVKAGVLDTRFSELAKSFVDNGFAYSFMVSLVDNGINRVDGYSEELVDSITEKFEKTDPQSIRTPNIIFVQMESFFDLNAMKNVKFDKNPVPNFTRYVREYPSGLLTVPVIGAGTANTEFEVVTGMKVSDFGAGEYPYKTILTENRCESIATNLKNHGYTSHFIHNYRGTFYGRNVVYNHLGYDNFYSIEYMSGYEKNENGWAKDGVLLKYINECLDSTDGTDLITAISVQGHGTYAGITDFEKHVTVTDCDKEQLRSSYEYYANQIYEMDLFLEDLIQSLSERNEDIILVIYGDHLPSFELQNRDLSGRNIYQTDYFIWNNMGIEYTEEDIPAYRLNSKILESVNIRDGVINACHQYCRNDEDYLDSLMTLEYDMLYGNNYAGFQKASSSDSQMSINKRKTEISGITKKEGTKDTYIVSGNGFTENSYVKIEYRVVFTKFIDENTLEFTCKQKDTGKAITVWEKDVGDSNILFIEKE